METKSNFMKDKKSRQKSEGSQNFSNLKDNKNKLIAVIRISGMVKVKGDIAGTLDRLRLRRKYVCVLVDGGDKNLNGMLKKVKFYVAYGSVDKDVLIELIKERGQSVEKGKKVDAEKVASELISGKKLSDLGLKAFFRLHPPRKGIKSKLQYPRGVLGDNGEDINKLIRRML